MRGDMLIKWRGVTKKLGSTAVVVAVLGFLAGNAFQFVLARIGARLDAGITQDNAQKDRVRNEIVRWSNPILTAVYELQDRLRNIQDKREKGYLALSKDAKDKLDPNWSMSYEYFLSSSVFLFSRYFCTVGLLEESLSVELFRKHEIKDAFFAKIYDVEDTLSLFPNDDKLSSITNTWDRQVFGLQQRGVGGALVLSTNGNSRCMRYSEFVEKWKEPAFQKAMEPITNFLDGLGPDTRPWMRLTLMAAALEKLCTECRRRLSLEEKDDTTECGGRRPRL
jgi:hypothetical protein